MTRNLKDLIKKSFVFNLALIFALSGINMGWSQTSGVGPHSSAQLLTIPEVLGTTTDFYLPSSGRPAPLLIHIEDAHSHFSTQAKIREILNYLRIQHHVDAVYIEGASGSIDAELFNIFPDSKMNVKAAERWMKEGQFSGAEVFGIENGNSVRLFGVENPKLYSENLKEFRETHRLFKTSEAVIHEWNSRLKQLKSKIYLGDLKKWDETADQFVSEKINILEYSRVLKTLAGKYQVSLQQYPHLTKLLELDNFSESVLQDQWKTEWNSVRNFIENKIPDSDSVKRVLLENWSALGSQDFVIQNKKLLLANDPRLYFELLVTAAKGNGFSFELFKELPRVARFLILQKEIAGPELFSEMSDLESALGNRLIETRREKEMFELDSAFRHLNRLFHLAVDRSEWKQIRENQKNWSPSALYPRILKLENEMLRKVKKISPIDDALLSRALNFYDLAYRREDALVQNSLKQMKSSRVSKAVLITGGFHSEGIRAKLKNANFGYVSVRPSVMEFGEESRYLEIMLGQRDILPGFYFSQPETNSLAAPAQLPNPGRLIVRTLLDSGSAISPSDNFREALGHNLNRLAEKGAFNGVFSFNPVSAEVGGTAAVLQVFLRSAENSVLIRIPYDSSKVPSVTANSLGRGRKKSASDKVEKPSVDKVAIWDFRNDVGKTTAVVLAGRGIQVNIFDLEKNIKRTEAINHEGTRQQDYEALKQKGLITTNSVDVISPEDKATLEGVLGVKGIEAELERRRTSPEWIERKQAEVVKNHSVIFVDPGIFLEAKNRSEFDSVIRKRSAGFGRALKSLRAKGVLDKRVFVVRSQIPARLTDEIMTIIFEASGNDTNFSVVHVPDNFRSGHQIKDMKTQKALLGFPEFEMILPKKIRGKEKQRVLSALSDTQEWAKKAVLSVLKGNQYTPDDYLVMDSRSAEMAPFSTQLFLFTKLLTAMAFAQLVHALGGDIEKVVRGAGLDIRIGLDYMKVAFGVGGKLRKFLNLATDENGGYAEGSFPQLWYEFVKTLKKEHMNQIEWFKKIIVNVLTSNFGFHELANKEYAILGLAAKADNGSLSGSPALDLVKWLTQKKPTKIYFSDPYVDETEFGKWVEEIKTNSTEDVRLAFQRAQELKVFDFQFLKDPLGAMRSADATIITVDHKQFKELQPEDIAAAVGPEEGALFESAAPIFDGRNIYELGPIRKSRINYISIGRTPIGPKFKPTKDRDAIEKAVFNPAAGPKNVVVLGSKYVGLTTGTAMADTGHDVTIGDVDVKRITHVNAELERARRERIKDDIDIGIYEPGLPELIIKNVKKKRLKFVPSHLSLENFKPGDNITDAILRSDVLYLAVGTPQADDGKADLQYVMSATRHIGHIMKNILPGQADKNYPKRKVIVVKSTVPPRTFDEMKHILEVEFGLKEEVDFDIASNPEFLQEGKAVKDVFEPHRTVLGVESEFASKILRELWSPLEKRHPHEVLVTDRVSASLIKYLSNVFLAISISFANAQAWLAEKVGASYEKVVKSIKTHPHVAQYSFLGAGIGYGGSCFPKDVSAAIYEFNLTLQKIFETATTAVSINYQAPEKVFEKIVNALGDAASGRKDKPLQGKKITLFGSAFKNKTDDVRETPTLPLLLKLEEAGARVVVIDPLPKAQENFRKLLAEETGGKNFGDRISIIDGPKYRDERDDEKVLPALIQAAEGSDMVAIVNDWPIYRKINFQKLSASMQSGRTGKERLSEHQTQFPVLYDIRNLLQNRREEIVSYGLMLLGTGEKPIIPITSKGTDSSIGLISEIETSEGASLGFYVSDSAREQVRKWTDAQINAARRSFANDVFTSPADISPDARIAAGRIFSNASVYLPGELIIPVEAQSDESLLKILEPIALQLRGESKKDISIFTTSAFKSKIESTLKSLKVDPAVIHDYVHFKGSHESLELYLIGRTAKFGDGRVVLIGDSGTLTNVSVPGIRKISRNQVLSGKTAQDIQQKDRLVAQVAAIDLGFDLLSASEWIPQPDKLQQDGSMLFMKEDFFTQFAEKWIAEMHAQMAILIAA